jgi:hypothetical protein
MSKLSRLRRISGMRRVQKVIGRRVRKFTCLSGFIAIARVRRDDVTGVAGVFEKDNVELIADTTNDAVDGAGRREEDTDDGK